MGTYYQLPTLILTYLQLHLLPFGPSGNDPWLVIGGFNISLNTMVSRLNSSLEMLPKTLTIIYQSIYIGVLFLVGELFKQSLKFHLYFNSHEKDFMIQGDPNQKLQFQMAVTPQISIFNPVIHNW